MNRICRQCNGIITDDAAAFCDRCGMPLPPPRERENPICRQCGRVQTDMQSRFCDRCGTPLALPAPVAPQVPAATKRMICPVCGFSNAGFYLFFCRKCGSSLVSAGAYTPRVPDSGRQAVCPSCGFPNSGDNLFFCRKCGSALAPDGPVVETRPAGTGPGRGKIVDHPALTSKQTGTDPAQAYPSPVADLPRSSKEGRQKSSPKKRSLSRKKLVIISAAIILLLLGIAFFTENLPGWGGPGENAGILDNKSTAQIATTPAKVIATPTMPARIIKPGTVSGGPVTNGATAVFTDLPLDTKQITAPDTE